MRFLAFWKVSILCSKKVSFFLFRTSRNERYTVQGTCVDHNHNRSKRTVSLSTDLVYKLCILDVQTSRITEWECMLAGSSGFCKVWWWAVQQLDWHRSKKGSHQASQAPSHCQLLSCGCSVFLFLIIFLFLFCFLIFLQWLCFVSC